MKSALGESLECEKTEMGLYRVEDFGKTTVPGVSAAGDIMSILQSVLGAPSLGQTAGAGCTNELLNEDFASELGGSAPLAYAEELQAVRHVLIAHRTN
jgi:hypothetical protein